MALWITSCDPIELRPNATEDDLQIVMRAVYRQVLGNAHVMDSERLASAESQLKNGEMTVRGFVRAVAQSDLYRSLFFDNSYAYRCIELNFKHLLGRAPQDQSEIAEHVERTTSQGYSADIDSYLDSDEYRSNFGENIVPYCRSNGTIVGTKMSALIAHFPLREVMGPVMQGNPPSSLAMLQVTSPLRLQLQHGALVHPVAGVSDSGSQSPKLVLALG